MQKSDTGNKIFARGLLETQENGREAPGRVRG